MLNHTPGPWAVEFCFETGIAITAKKDAHKFTVAEAWSMRDAIPSGEDMESDAEAVANAALIAAAPELLQACRAIKELIRGGMVIKSADAERLGFDITSQLDDAICKATNQ